MTNSLNEKEVALKILGTPQMEKILAVYDAIQHSPRQVGLMLLLGGQGWLKAYDSARSHIQAMKLDRGLTDEQYLMDILNGEKHKESLG